MLNKITRKQKILGKRQKLLVQIDNFQFNEGRANKTIGLRRMLETNMLECGKYIHCEKDKKTNSKFNKKTKLETN